MIMNKIRVSQQVLNDFNVSRATISPDIFSQKYNIFFKNSLEIIRTFKPEDGLVYTKFDDSATKSLIDKIFLFLKKNDIIFDVVSIPIPLRFFIMNDILHYETVPIKTHIIEDNLDNVFNKSKKYTLYIASVLLYEEKWLQALRFVENTKEYVNPHSFDFSKFEDITVQQQVTNFEKTPSMKMPGGVMSPDEFFEKRKKEIAEREAKVARIKAGLE